VVPASEREFNGSLLVNGFRYDTFEDEDFFTVDVLWDVQSPPDNDYITFLHVYRDTGGEPVTQDDFRPELPTQYWQYGEDFRLNYRVRPPEAGWQPGNYEIHLGWYEREEPHTRMVLTPVEGQAPSTYMLFKFSVLEDGTLDLPEFETMNEATEEPLSGAPQAPTPEGGEPSILEEASEEPERTEEATEPSREESTVEAQSETTEEALDAELTPEATEE
jgi:hypothetical protein